MADEVIQACQIELEGCKYVFKGSVEVAQFLARFLKALHEATTKKWIEAGKNRFKNRKGERSFVAIDKMSNTSGQCIEISKDALADFEEAAKENKLHYHIMVNPDPNSNRESIYIPDNEFAAYENIIKNVENKLIENNKNNDTVYKRKIDEIKEQLKQTEKDKNHIGVIELREPYEQKEKELNRLLSFYEQAREENKKTLSQRENILTNGVETKTLQEYILSFRITDAEKSPEIAFAEYEKGVEIGPKLTAKELFQSIRDKGLIPESGIHFYVPEIGAIVTREFKVDEKTELAYSIYHFKTDKGEQITFSDKDITKDEWNEKHLPLFLEKAHILEGTLCRTFDSEEKLKLFTTYHNHIKNPAKQRIEERMIEGKEVFTDAEVKNEIVNTMSEHEKGLASAKINGNTLTFTADIDRIISRNGRLELKLSENETLKFSTVSVGKQVPGTNFFNITIAKDQAKPVLITGLGENRTEKEISLDTVKEVLSAANSAVENIKTHRR